MAHVEPHNEDDHPHHVASEKETFIFALASLWSVLFALAIFLTITGWFIPNIRSDIPTAVITTARIVGAIGVAALIHAAIQLALITNRPGHDAPRWKKAIDYVTSFLPFIAIIIGHIVAARQYNRPYAAWWIEVRAWIDVIVVLATFFDLGPTIKLLWKGRPRPEDEAEH